MSYFLFSKGNVFVKNPRKDWKNEFNIGKEMSCEDWNKLKNGKLIIVITTRPPGFAAVKRLFEGYFNILEAFLACSKG